MFTGIPTGARRVALAQAGLAPVTAWIGGMIAGVDAGFAVLYGALTAFAVTAVLVWREQQAMQHPEWDQHHLFTLFIRVGIERLLLLLGLLAVGLGVLKLMPLPLLLGLLFAQFAWLAAAISRNNK